MKQSESTTYQQPNRKHVIELLRVLDHLGMPVFFKGNLDWSPRRKEFPDVASVVEPVVSTGQMRMFE